MYRGTFESDTPQPGSYGRYWPEQQQQPDPATEMVKTMVPMMTVMPAITQAQTIVDALRAELAALPVPAVAAGAQPTKAEFDALLDYTKKCASVLDRSDLASSTAYVALRKQFMLALMTPLFTSGMGGMGGSGGMMLMMFMMMMMTNGSLFF